MQLGKLVTAASLVLLLGACGGSSEDELVRNSTMSVFPESTKFDIGGCMFDAVDPLDNDGFDPNQYQDIIVEVNVRDSLNQPLGDVDLDVALDFSSVGSGPSIIKVLNIYDDAGGNGDRIADDSELVEDESYSVRTDPQGDAYLIVRVNISCVTYTGNLYIYSNGGPDLISTFEVEASGS